MAGMESGGLTPWPNSKRKAAEAALDDDLSDAENDVAVAATTPAPAAIKGAQEAAPMQPTRRIMSQEWIDSIQADEIKPLPFNERLLQNPELAEIFHSHEKSRAWFPKYQNWIRHELETKGYVEVDDDYEETVRLRHAVHEAVFYGRKDEEKEAWPSLKQCTIVV